MQNYSKDQPQRFTRAARGALLASALFSTVAHAQTESGAADDAAGADEEITVTGEPLEPVAALTCPDALYGHLCDGSVYAVPFDTVAADVDSLIQAAQDT